MTTQGKREKKSKLKVQNQQTTMEISRYKTEKQQGFTIWHTEL